ncbi:hypothetical protein MVEN_02558400 [Mycena venus]|uniref:LCCL domain-containing protein n=1 Tax=Mycena venus TaxID=2733690 RepID=A0A8H6U2J4_9AGAR|nr:hypothetical protein MVEN_02558400 [Mycena venus]
MAVPADFTILNLSGKFTMNKAMSGDTDTILTLQDVGWVKRKVIANATVTLAIKHYKDDAGVEKIDIDQTLTGGFPGPKEERTLSWTERSDKDGLFGHVVGKTRRCQVSDLEEEFLKKNWTPDTIEHGVIQFLVKSDTPKSGTSWIANQAWGIQEVNGERRYARNMKFTGPKGEDIETLLVYDYVGPV